MRTRLILAVLATGASLATVVGPAGAGGLGSDSSAARFRYPRAPDDYVAVNLSGCRSVTNGPRTRASLGRRGSRLVRTLRRLTG
jgi:hypothetical protein